MTQLGLVLAWACVAFLGVGGVAAAKPAERHPVAPAYDFSAVTAYMDAGYKSLGYPGASMLVAKDSRVIYERYFGDYTPATQVQIASSTKWLSAAVIMSLVDDGKIDLDAKLSHYLPQFTGKKGEPTIRQMFSHTSGMLEPPGPPGARAGWDYSLTMQQYADRMAQDVVMAGDPGSGIRYASVSMQIVGAIAEKVTGKSWAELFRARVADPCDMPHTFYGRTPGTTQPATLKETTRNPMLAGGAYSTLHDYAHFLQMLADHGVYNGKRVLSEKAVREMEKDQTGDQPLLRASNDRLGRKSHYGIGEWIDVETPQGRTIQVSSPGAWGFRPWLNLDRNLYGIIMVQRKVGGPIMNATYDPWKLIDLVHEAVDARPGGKTDPAAANKGRRRP